MDIPNQLPSDLYNQVLTFLHPYDHWRLAMAGWPVKNRLNLKYYWFQQLKWVPQRYRMDFFAHRRRIKVVGDDQKFEVEDGNPWFGITYTDEQENQHRYVSTDTLHYYINEDFFDCRIDTTNGIIQRYEYDMMIEEGPINLNAILHAPSILLQIIEFIKTQLPDDNPPSAA